MNILMTGSDGYIGSHLKVVLRDNGYHVNEYPGDVREITTMAFIDIDMVIHLAGQAGVRASFDQPEFYYDNNVNGSKAIFKATYKLDLPIIYTSSSNAAEWWTNPYATTKKIMEEIAPFNSLGIRPHTVYPGREDMLYCRLKNDVNSVGYINGEHTRDFTHIEDFCSALLTLVENYSIIDDKVVDIGTGKPTRTLDVARSFGWDGLVRWNSTPKERTHTKADITLLTKLGWSPKHEICNTK